MFFGHEKSVTYYILDGKGAITITYYKRRRRGFSKKSKETCRRGKLIRDVIYWMYRVCVGD